RVERVAPAPPVRLELAGLLHDAAFAEYAPLRAPALAALRLDDDDTIGRRRPVQRGRRRTLDDVDRLDVLGAERVEAVDALRADVAAVRQLLIVEPDAVHHDEWLVRQRERARSSDA